MKFSGRVFDPKNQSQVRVARSKMAQIFDPSFILGPNFNYEFLLTNFFFLMWAVLRGLPLFDHLRSVFFHLSLHTHINIQQYWQMVIPSKKVDSNDLLFLEEPQIANSIEFFHSILPFDSSTPQKKDDFLRRGSNPRPSSSMI